MSVIQWIVAFGMTFMAGVVLGNAIRIERILFRRKHGLDGGGKS